jgi:hypothetical protein
LLKDQPGRCVAVGDDADIEIAAAHQSFLNAGFRSAAQVEFVLIIGDEALHPVKRRCGSKVSGILFLKTLSPAIVG